MRASDAASKREAGTQVARCDRIALRYERGDRIDDIATAEGVDVKTVRNVARRRGLPRRRSNRTERNRRIADRYAAGDPVHQIASDEGVNRSYVRTVARRAGLSPRQGWQRRYPLDEGVFDQPTDVGWWLIGLLAADGSINEREHRVSLSQRADGSDVLSAFYEYVGSSGRPLRRIAPTDGWGKGEYREARIFSERICRALARHGLVPRKGASMKFSEKAAARTAVWLGLFDGDGSAGVSRNHGIPRIDFHGAPDVMGQCARFWAGRLRLQTARAPALLADRGGVLKVALYGTNAAVAARMMLEASPVSLARKRHVLEQIASDERSPHWGSARANAA